MHGSIKLGISACLLGEQVRYDGGQKRDHYLVDVLGRFVVWTPVCPEVECGLPVPREAMCLVGDPASPRLMTMNTHVDFTTQMQAWITRKLPQLEKEDLCGFIFKTRSPSSGMRGVKVFTESGKFSRKGSGLFAAAFMARFPEIPVEDEERLRDARLRENFIERIFVFLRWKEMVKRGLTIRNLVAFHTEHKLLLMSHSPKFLRELDKLGACAGEADPDIVFDSYFKILMTALRLQATVKKHVNVFQHMMGYFKKVLPADEKEELLNVVGQYRQGLVPLVVPVTLFNYYVRKFGEPYLGRQVYLHPHPAELMLRNHV